jgi:hypothetical protein
VELRARFRTGDADADGELYAVSPDGALYQLRG